ncbi:hypothetical protein QQ045_010603 [Rhodiola kirilowii]
MHQPRRYTFGTPNEATHPNFIRAALAKFFSTFIFAGEGSILAIIRMYGKTTDLTFGALLAVALAHAFSLFAAIASSMNISGSHVNPVVILSGRISLLRAVYYWITQLLDAVIATVLLRLATDGMRPIGYGAPKSPWREFVEFYFQCSRFPENRDHYNTGSLKTGIDVYVISSRFGPQTSHIFVFIHSR